MRSVNGNLLKFFVGSSILYQGCLQSIPNQYSRPSSDTARQFQLILKLSIRIRQFLFSCLSIQNYAPFNIKILQLKEYRGSILASDQKRKSGRNRVRDQSSWFLIIHQGEYSIPTIQLDAKSRTLFFVFIERKAFLESFF